MEFGIWGRILLVICHIASKMEKKELGSNNDDITNLQSFVISNMKNYKIRSLVVTGHNTCKVEPNVYFISACKIMTSLFT